MSGKVYPLKFPVELKNAAGEVTDTIVSVTMNRLKGKDMRDIANATAKGPGDAMAVLVCRSGGIPPSTFDKLDAEDAADLAMVATDFIGGVLPTGVT